MNERRAIILYNPQKARAAAMLDTVVELVGRRARVTGMGTVEQACGLVREPVDRAIVLGGDGSILSVARALGSRQVPIIGVNFGKLGYLAEFGLDELSTYLDAAFDDPSLVSRRMMMQAWTGEPSQAMPAINDCVIHAGPPFRMIQLRMSVDGSLLTETSCDGLVIATPSGSTAHNMSVGGPIIHSSMQAMVLTPISPHSLTHRPLVVDAGSQISVELAAANSGTALVIDGQVTLPLVAGDRVQVSRGPHDFLLVNNPAQTPWSTLVRKLKWGQ